MFSDHEQKIINQQFGGDADAFIKDVTRGRKEKVKWNDLVTAATTLPSLELTALKLIKFLLGYVPPNYLTLPQEPFLRALLNEYQSKAISFNQLLEQGELHVKLIRNEEMLSYINFNYDRTMYQDYFEYLPEYKDKVCQRLTAFLGYQPMLEHSVAAEIILRQAMINDRFYFPDTLTTTDMQAIVAIKYREVLLAQGREAADASPLVAIDLIAQNSNSKKKGWADLL